MTAPKRAVRRLAGARVVSLLGTGAANVALLITMYERTGSAAWVSGTLVATHGVQVFFALFTASLGDRFDRRRLMIACEVGGSACYAAMVFAHAPVALLTVALFGAVVASPFHASSAAAIPNLVGPEHLSWANSMVGVGRNLGMTFGPVLGGFITAAFGPGAVFGANAVSYLISAAVIATIHGRFSGLREGTEDHRIAAGLGFLWRDRLLRTLMLAEAVLVLGLGLIQVARVPLVESFGLGSVALGLLDALWGAGLLIGSLAARTLNARREPVTFVVGLAGVAVATMAIGASPWFVPIVGFNFLVGLADSMDLIAGQGIRQRRTHDAVLSRVIAANSSICVVAQMVGYGASGVLIPVIGPQGIYLLCGLVVAASAVICVPAVRLARPAPKVVPEPPPEEAAHAQTHLPVT
ncbi:MAG: MFS transporter [Actinomycetota bacterium]|nr:MFS transporter [Actinomycetota bacterium]